MKNNNFIYYLYVYMGFKRNFYYLFGWEYPEKIRWDCRQTHLKYILCKQINETKNIKHILKKRENTVMMENKNLME